MRPMLSLLAILAFGYALYVGGLYFLQRKFIFQPSLVALYPMDGGVIGARTAMVRTEDGLDLIAWEHAAQHGYPTILYFHGNGGTLRDRIAKFKMFVDKGFGLLAISYRGYGGNPGQPSEEGFYTDARAAIAYAKAQGLAPERMIFYGESLGTGVAIHMAAETPPGALILEAPYTSIRDIAAGKHRLIPFVSLLVRDPFDSRSKITSVRAPLLLFHGERDAVIPAHHGRALLEAANEPKKGVFFQDNGHTDFDVSEIGILLEDWARKHGLMRD